MSRPGLTLTEEQKKRIEINRQLALARRIEKLSPVKAVSVASSQPVNNVHLNNYHINNSQSLPTNKYSNSNISNAIHTLTSNCFGTSQTQNSCSQSLNANKWTNKSTPAATSLPSANFSKLTASKEQLVNNSGQKVSGKCVFVGNSSFVVEVGYHGPLIEYFKQLKTRNYDATTKCWSFGIEEYDTLIKGVRGFRPDVEIEGLPQWILQIFGQDNKKVDEVPDADLSQVDEKLVQTLLPFQRDGVNFAIYHSGRLLIADDMGLGKTLQAICIACYYRREWPVLIVSPSSVRFDWAQQICKWLPSVAPCDVNVVETGKASATSGIFNIVSYDLLSKKSEELRRKMFKVIIMDESHFLKNSKTVRTKAAMPLLKNAKRVLLLSGTPALSRPNELFSQITAVCPNLFKFHEFGVRYCAAKKMQWGWDYSSSSNMVELQALLEKRVMIRRQKKDVLTQLPDKYRQVIMLDPHSVHKNTDLKAANKQLSNSKLKGLKKRGALLEYFHETCKAKLTAVRDYILDLIEGDKKFLMFAHHKEMLDCVQDAIVEKAPHIQYIRIDGRTSSEQRNFFCSKFQTCDTYRAAILSITAANAGLNLSAANIVVFAELFWNPGILVQAEDRAHRIGQKDSVNVQYLVAQHTADDYIWPLVQNKLDILSKAGLAKDDFAESDTKRLSDRTQQSILDMFSSAFIEDTVPEASTADATIAPTISVNVNGLSPEKVDVELVSSSPLSVKITVVTESGNRSPRPRTPRKCAATDWTRKMPSQHEVSSQLRPTQTQSTPSKRQASISSFFDRTPPKKILRLDGDLGFAMRQTEDLETVIESKVDVGGCTKAEQDPDEDYCGDMAWMEDEFTVPFVDSDANVGSAVARSEDLVNRISQESKPGDDKSPWGLTSQESKPGGDKSPWGLTSQESKPGGDKSPWGLTSQESKTGGDKSPWGLTSQESKTGGGTSPNLLTSQESETGSGTSPWLLTSQECKKEGDRYPCTKSQESAKGSNASNASGSILLWLQDLDWDDEI